MNTSILLSGGTVVDGTGGPGHAADVLVADGKIAGIGDFAPSSADRVIDVSDMVVAPGFIDIHTHSDITVLLDPKCESKVRQGVTTDVTGNCGTSPFPLAPDKIELHRNHLSEIDESVLDLSWTDVAGYAARVERSPTAFNVAPLVGHGTLRTAGMGFDQRSPTPKELATMKRLLGRQLQQGAFGFSTGLTLVPGTYADESELVELVRVVGQHDALYATHTRSDGGGEFSGVELAVRTATEAGSRLQFSHAAINTPDLWGRASDVVAIIEDARHGGLDVMFDVYPYDASSSAMTQYLPTWVMEGGTETMRARMADSAVYDRALAELRNGFWGIPWFWDRVLLSKVAEPDDWSVGLTIEQAAARVGKDPAEWALQLCVDHGNSARVVLFYRTEEDMKTFLAHPLSMVGSDGSAISFDTHGEQPHPRSYGTYPRVLGRYVREQGLLSLPEAIRKCTSAVAERLQLTDRGTLREGLTADVTVFDPEAIIDKATFAEPATPPVGVNYVMVGGQLVVEEGEQTDARPGRVLRRR